MDNIKTHGREEKIFLPNNDCIGIRHSDWRRIYRNVKSLPTNPSSLKNWAFLFWGISASAIFSLVAVYSTTNKIETSALTILWVASVTSVVLGFVFLALSKKSSSTLHTTSSEIAKEMEDISSAIPGFLLDEPKKIEVPLQPYLPVAKEFHPNFTIFNKMKFRVGGRVKHESFGEGQIVELTEKGDKSKAIVDFQNFGRKNLMLKFANLKIIK